MTPSGTVGYCHTPRAYTPPPPTCCPPVPHWGGGGKPSVNRPEPSEAFIQNFPQQAAIYMAATAQDKPNYMGALIPVCHMLNMKAWKRYQHLLEDTTPVPMLEFGFPVGYVGVTQPARGLPNHSSATQHPTHEDKFLQTELGHEAIMGPFNQHPFQPWSRTNPLMMRPKRDSEARRVILDLSFPDGQCECKHTTAGTLGGPFQTETATHTWPI